MPTHVVDMDRLEGKAPCILRKQLAGLVSQSLVCCLLVVCKAMDIESKGLEMFRAVGHCHKVQARNLGCRLVQVGPAPRQWEKWEEVASEMYFPCKSLLSFPH